MFNPTFTIALMLRMAKEEADDPRLAFITLLTAATIAGKIIGLPLEEIAAKISEVDPAADLVIEEITGGRNESA